MVGQLVTPFTSLFFGCPIAIWIVRASPGSDKGENAIQWVFQRLWRKGKHIALTRGFAYEINPEAFAFNQMTTLDSPIKLTQHGNFGTWPRDAVQVLVDLHTRILLAAGAPLRKKIRGIYSHNKTRTLGSTPLRPTWFGLARGNHASVEEKT